MVDDVELSTNPFIYKDLVEEVQFQGYGNGSTVLTGNVTDIDFTETIDSHSAWNGSQFTVPKDGIYDISGLCGFTTAHSSAIDLYVDAVKDTQIGHAPLVKSVHDFNHSAFFNAGEVLSIRVGSNRTLNNDVLLHHISINAVTTTEHVITPAKSNMTDWESYTPTGAFTSNSTYSGKYRRVGGNLEVDARIDFTGTPNVATFTMGIPSGLVIDTTKLTNSTTGDGDLGSFIANVSAAGDGYGGKVVYSSTTSIQAKALVASSASNHTWTTVTDSSPLVYISGRSLSVRFTVPIEGWSSDASFLAAIPTPKICYIKDVKPSGTLSGTFTSGAWQTRDLNTLSGDTSFVSISTNQIILQSGKYTIKAMTPSYFVQQVQSKLRNITNSTDAIIGSSVYNANTGNGNTINNILEGELELTGTTTFEVQHRCTTTKASNGFGLACTFGVNEIYTQVEITKLR